MLLMTIWQAKCLMWKRLFLVVYCVSIPLGHIISCPHKYHKNIVLPSKEVEKLHFQIIPQSHCTIGVKQPLILE